MINSELLKTKIKERLKKDPYLPPKNEEDLNVWYETCPECNELRTDGCRCVRSDSRCKNGHRWHFCTVHHVKVPGDSDHKISIDVCTCGKEPLHSNLRVHIFNR